MRASAGYQVEALSELAWDFADKSTAIQFAPGDLSQ